MSVLEQQLEPVAKVLDLGCGPRDQAAPVQFLGFQYLGGGCGIRGRRSACGCLCVAICQRLP